MIYFFWLLSEEINNFGDYIIIAYFPLLYQGLSEQIIYIANYKESEYIHSD